VRLNYEIAGEGERFVVLAGSLGSTLEMWEPQLPAFTPHFTVLRYDQPGHGRSDLPGEPTIAAFARELAGLLDELGQKSVLFCGLSLGGAVGMRLALDRPELIERMALCCTAARFATTEFWDERIAATRAGGVRSVAEAVLARWFTPDFPDLQRYRDMLLSTSTDGYVCCCEALREWDGRGALGAVRAPTVCIAAADDPATPPAKLNEIASEIPDARLVVIDNGRHLVNVERADAFNDALLAHFAA
jgi:3-oxoadipate enol-lactonase